MSCFAVLTPLPLAGRYPFAFAGSKLAEWTTAAELNRVH